MPTRKATILWLGLLLLCIQLPATAATQIVKMANFTFSPTNITIFTGDTITWSNTVTTAHDTTSSSGHWASPTFSRPNTFSYRFNTNGFYPYICALHINAHPEQTGTVTVVTSQNVAPLLSISSPASGAIFTAPANFSFSASASDQDGTISQVEFLNGTTSLFVDQVSPYSTTVNIANPGSYTLNAVATDNGGAKTSRNVSITVRAPPNRAVISNVRFDGTTVSLTFFAQNGYSYVVQHTDSFTAPNWQNLPAITGAGQQVEVRHSGSLGNLRYYRVAAQ